MANDSVDGILRRHEEKKRVSHDVRVQIERFVARLIKKYPDHRDVIMRHLEGQWQALLDEREKEKRDARQFQKR